MLNLILFGPPGSGKGTQAEKLIVKYNLLHISTGDLFRYELGNNTELGQLAKSYMSKGELVPDAVTIGMLRKKVEENPHVSGYIFDGFPRTTPQAEALDALLAEMQQEGKVLNTALALFIDNHQDYEAATEATRKLIFIDKVCIDINKVIEQIEN